MKKFVVTAPESFNAAAVMIATAVLMKEGFKFGEAYDEVEEKPKAEPPKPNEDSTVTDDVHTIRITVNGLPFRFDSRDPITLSDFDFAAKRTTGAGSGEYNLMVRDVATEIPIGMFVNRWRELDISSDGLGKHTPRNGDAYEVIPKYDTTQPKVKVAGIIVNGIAYEVPLGHEITREWLVIRCFPPANAEIDKRPEASYTYTRMLDRPDVRRSLSHNGSVKAEHGMQFHAPVVLAKPVECKKCLIVVNGVAIETGEGCLLSRDTLIGFSQQFGPPQDFRVFAKDGNNDSVVEVGVGENFSVTPFASFVVTNARIGGKPIKIKVNLHSIIAQEAAHFMLSEAKKICRVPDGKSIFWMAKASGVRTRTGRVSPSEESFTEDGAKSDVRPFFKVTEGLEISISPIDVDWSVA